MSEKENVFSTGAILSAATGVLLCEFGDLCEILNFLTGDELFTHQLPRASLECKPHLLRQCPWILEVKTSDISKENWQERLNDAIARFGSHHTLVPLPAEQRHHVDPLQEAVELMGGDQSKVVAVHCWRE